MTSTETYVTVLIGVIVGIAIARIVSFVGELIVRRQNVKPYWVHLVWIVGLFLLLIQSWWAMRLEWKFSDIDNLPEVSFLLVSPILLYLASVLLCPKMPDIGARFDMEEAFRSSQGIFFVVIGVFFLVLIPESVLMNESVALSSAENWVRVAVAAAFFCAYFFVRSWRSFEFVFPILVIAALAGYLAVFESTVG